MGALGQMCCGKDRTLNDILTDKKEFEKVADLAFDKFDADHNNYIDQTEYDNVTSELVNILKTQCSNINEDEIKKIFKNNKNNSQNLTRSEWTKLSYDIIKDWVDNSILN